MHRSSRIHASRLLAAGLCAGLALPSFAQVSVRSVKVLGSKDTVEVEVEASDRIVPQTRVLTGPDRLVIDFPNSVPALQVRNQSIDRGEVKDVRVGLFQSKPPVTRVVLDLKTARSFQIFPYGRTVMIKVVGDAAISNASANSYQPPHLVSANYTASVLPVSMETAPVPPLQVTYQDGMLGIWANKVTLSEVLYAVQQRTGADISIAAGAEQEKVVAEIAPAPAAEVLAHLLNGSRFNFLILNSTSDPRQLDRVILTTRGDGNAYIPPPQQAQANDDLDESPAPPRNHHDNVAQAKAPPDPDPDARANEENASDPQQQ